MALQHAYAVTNLFGGLATSAFVWSDATTTNRAFLNDGRMDKRFVWPAQAATIIAPAFLVIDMGAATALTAIALLNTNLSSNAGAKVSIVAADSADLLTNTVAVKVDNVPCAVAPRNKDHVFQFASTSKRYWGLIFQWSGSFAFTVGELFGAVTTPLTRYTVFGHGEDELYYGSEFEGYSGETRGHFLSGPFRMKTLPFQELAEAEKDEMMALRRATFGGALPVLWCQQYEATGDPAPAAYQDVIYGHLTGNKSFPWSEADYGLYSVPSLTLKSLAREVGS